MEKGCKQIIVYDNYDDFYPGKEENAAALLEAAKDKDSKFVLKRADILDYSSLSAATKDSDLVFHLAGQAGIRYCNATPIKANKVNVEGTLNVLLAAKENGIKKVVYASSSSIFGNPLYLPIDEKHPTNPSSPYGVSKLAAEHYCRVFASVYGMQVLCLRYFSVYGPRGRPDQVIYAFAQRIANGMKPTIFGDGEQTRDFTYVSDIVDATILAMEKEVKSGEVFNLGHGSKITINELAHRVISGMKKDPDSFTPIYEEKSKGDFPDTEANNEKAKYILGWNPRVTVDEGLKVFFDWFLQRPQ